MRTDRSDARTGFESWAATQTSNNLLSESERQYLFKTWVDQTRPAALLPYPFIALMLAACGGGGGGGTPPVTSGNPPPATSGTPPPATSDNNAGASIRKTIWVYDPPVGGAPIFVDLNGNLRVDNGDLRLQGATDSTGKVTVEIPVKYRDKMLLADLRDKANLQHNGALTSDVWAAPANSDVISVMTTLLVHAGGASEDMKALLHGTEEKTSGFDPFHHNPYDTTEKSYNAEFIKALLPVLERSLTLLKSNSPANADAAPGNTGATTATELPKTLKEIITGLLKSAVNQAGSRISLQEQEEQRQNPETVDPPAAPIQPPKQPVREESPDPQPAPPTMPTPQQSPNKAPKVILFQAGALYLYETDGTDKPQILKAEFFIRDDNTQIDPSSHITVERLVAHNEWKVDDRFAARPIKSTERTDDFLFRTKKGAVFDREHADDFESLDYAGKGFFWLRLRVDDGEGGITYAKTLFEMHKKPLTSGDFALRATNENLNQANNIFETNTVLQVTSTYKYPDSDQVTIVPHVTYQAFDPATQRPYLFTTTVEDPTSFTIDEAGMYLVTVQLKSRWMYGNDVIHRDFGYPKEYRIEIREPGGQPPPPSSAGATSTPIIDLEPMPDVDGVTMGAEII